MKNKDEAFIGREDFFEYKKPRERTMARLTQLAEMGMREVGIAEFGYPGIMSGLYIERVWHYSEEDWKAYVDWAAELLKEKIEYYAVYGEHTLGYVYTDFYTQKKKIGILHASILKGSPFNWFSGPQLISEVYSLRKATEKDFDEYRCQVPPGFRQIQNR